MIDEETLKALAGMADISEMEKQRLLVSGLGGNLRSAGLSIKPQRGRDLGGNIARAAYGIGGAIGDYQGLKAGAGITSAKQDLWAKLLRAMKPQGQATPETPYEYEDIR